MTPMKQTLAAAGMLWLSGGLASAAPAVVMEDLNLRAGPGYQHGIVEVIPGGATVDAGRCGGGWCQVNYAGRIGFARSGYLSFGNVSARAPLAASRAAAMEPITNPLLLPGIRPWTW